jgi:hypothetical protein
VSPIGLGQEAAGFVYHTPARGIQPGGVPVLFWNRLGTVRSPVTLDFGDGTAPRTIGLALHVSLKTGPNNVRGTETRNPKP